MLSYCGEFIVLTMLNVSLGDCDSLVPKPKYS